MLKCFHIIIKMEQLRRQNAQERNLLDSQEKKREDNFIKDVRNLFRLNKNK